MALDSAERRRHVSFFSYFTILSNISATVTFAVGGIALLLGRRGVPDGVRGAVTCYMSVTGIIYAVVLRADGSRPGSSSSGSTTSCTW